jgi:hypothetical protein
MDVIRHDQITANEPRISFIPRRNDRVMNIRIRETLRPVSGTNSEEDDRGLATKNENTFRWMPASNIIAHIWLDGVSPCQKSAVVDSVAKSERDLQSHKPPTADSVGRRSAELPRLHSSSSLSISNRRDACLPHRLEAYVPAIFPPHDRIFAFVPAASASLMSPLRL